MGCLVFIELQTRLFFDMIKSWKKKHIFLEKLYFFKKGLKNKDHHTTTRREQVCSR